MSSCSGNAGQEDVVMESSQDKDKENQAAGGNQGTEAASETNQSKQKKNKLQEEQENTQEEMQPLI
jgi:hypothetical protein